MGACAVEGLIAELLPRALCIQTQHKLISKGKMKAVDDSTMDDKTTPSAVHTGQVLVFRVKYTVLLKMWYQLLVCVCTLHSAII